MVKKLVLVLTICFGCFGCARAQEDDRLIEMSPDVRAELVFFFKKGTDWKDILEFHRTVIGIPAPNGTGFSSLPGMMTTVKVNVGGFEGEAINFQPSATEEEIAFVKKRVSESPLVYKIYENVIPNEITDLNPSCKGVQPSNKIVEPSRGKAKKFVVKPDPPRPQ